MSAFLQAVDAEIAALKRELLAHPAYVKMTELKRVRDLYGAVDKGPSVVADMPVQAYDAARKKSAPPMAGKSLEAVKVVAEILAAHQKPMRTAELMPHIIQRGIVFNGDAPQNILSSLLSRSEEVVSKGGHVGWALKAWDSAGGDMLAGSPPPADVQPEAQGREAGPGGGT